MAEKDRQEGAGAVLILGRDGCPHTRAARQAYADQGRQVAYTSVRSDPEAYRRLLELTGGAARVPVIVDGDAVAVGWQGRW